MKITYTDGTSVEMPRDVADAARLVSNWFRANQGQYWQFLDLCSRTYAYDLEHIRIVTDRAFRPTLNPTSP